jgi:hypothetical protein
MHPTIPLPFDCTLVFEEPVTPANAWRAEYVATRTLHEFANAHSAPRPLTISVSQEPAIYSLGHMGPAHGLYYHRSNTLRVVAQPDWTLWSLWHELCHATYATHDTEHENPGWGRWNKERQALVRRILAVKVKQEQ